LILFTAKIILHPQKAISQLVLATLMPSLMMPKVIVQEILKAFDELKVTHDHED
jgi:hypothetical protein